MFHLCSGKLIPIYYGNILILVYIFYFLFKILFNFSIYFFPVWPLHARHVNSETLTCNLAYFTNTTSETHYCRAYCRRDECLFHQPNGEMSCLFRKSHWRNAMLSLPRHVSLIVMTKSFEKQTPLIITFKTDLVPKKVCKIDPLGSICRLISMLQSSSLLNHG